MYTINFWPILVATLVAFGIGALWYSPILFGKAWMTLTHTSEADMAAARDRGVFKLYVIQIIITFITFSVIAFFMMAVAARSASDGAWFGAIAWLGFTLTDTISSMLWERKPFKLALIQSIGTLVNFVVGGAIIGAWR